MSRRGQTETLGLVMLVAITVLGVVSVVAVAGPALDDAEEASAVQRAEQSLSLLDSRVSLVALGGTDSQSVSLAGASGGTYRVLPDAGRITVYREDEDGNRIGSPIVNTSLGAVLYENGATTVAYQGGGVWRTRGSGAVMLSPPEFNYQGATLTLPVVRVTGEEASSSGAPTASISPNAVDVQKFPTAGTSNPLENGTVVVRVESEYARGWAQYFRERSTGNLSVTPSENRVELALVSRGSGGDFSLSEDPFELRGVGGSQPISEFAFTLVSGKGSKFNDLDWSLVADDGAQRFEVNLGGGNPCQTSEPEVTVLFEDGGTTHEWENTSAWEQTGSSFTYSCDGNTPTLAFDLTGETKLTYTGGSSPLSNDSVGAIVNNYVSEMGPNVALTITSKGKTNPPGNSGSTDLDASTVSIGYNSSSGRILTYLHVTENAVNVSVR
jgi:flagellin-like protein